MLSKKEKKALEYFSANDLGLCARPFKQAAADLKISEPELIGLLLRLQKKGLIKSLRGLTNPVRLGYSASALIAWRSGSPGKGNEEKLVKDAFLGDDRISHCYQRRPHRDFNYGIFTMMHAGTKKEISGFARKISRRMKFNYEVLFTAKELKKERLALTGVLC